MAILKYTNSNGETVTLNAYKVNNVMVKNEKGNSETDTMSQKVITDELNKINNKLDSLYTEWTGTQEEYDAIGVKDNNTIYFIKE